MSINPETRYAGKINSADTNYPWGSARNITTAGDGLGTPLEEDWLNDLFGMQQALLNDAGITPSGSPDTVLISQYLQAIKSVSGSRVDDYVAIRALDSSLLFDSQVITVTDDGVSGHFIVKTGTVTDDGGITIVFTDDSARYVERIFVGPENAEWFGVKGDGITDDSSEIAATNKTLGNTVRLTNKVHAISSQIALTRYSSLISLDEQSWPNSALKWIGAINSTMVITEPNQTYKGVAIDGDSVSGVTGILLGDDAAFKAYIKLDRDWVKNCDVGVQVSNVFDAKIEQTRIADNRVGVSIDPVSFGSDGGYTTTLWLDRCYITDNTEEGIIDNASIKNKMFTLSHSVIEKNGDATHPQVKLKEGQPNSIYNVYIEDATDTATAIEMPDGYVQNAYINGFSIGIDLGSGTSAFIMDNVKFASGGGPSITSSGVANAFYAGMRRCEFSGAPTLDSRIQVYEGCSGDMPTGVPEYAHVVTGAKPQQGVGTTPAITRDIEAWLHSDAGSVIAANDSYTFDIDIPVGRMAGGFASIHVTPQERLDPATNDLTWSVVRVSTTKARIVIANPTVGALTLDPLTWLLRMEQFTVTNGETGRHDGAANAPVLTNTNAAWTIDEHIGKTLTNVTDGSSTVVTSNTATTITGVLSGGTDNDWDISDVYRISNF